ncbi:NAD(FAD)-utilizing dehydrogenase [Marivivens niveibacter]|uniref:NAD(FAD)-utilizing dehydrogenase n=1 Tax=Marivivens niveibacter TaxID=1930667 RepID=A0A251X058_9RHOB|nr:TIGR03862 family flavoprotein [Marivivens niveibacter]OUD09563.1 NAD(FAD)-utilizing dehydrogenase [Marivivens niveibacter]
MAKAIVIGAGPAGLMAADVLSAAGVDVTIADAMPSPARKFLMAGKSGLNITKVTPDFMAPFGPVAEAMKNALGEFGPAEVIEWAQGLGQQTFTGSTGRVFPNVMKASPLLRNWLGRLDDRGVILHRRWRWVDWDNGGAVFDTPMGRQSLPYDVAILATGGASWSRLGSDGKWVDSISAPIAPFKPANMGFNVNWTQHMQSHFGAPVKGVELHAGEHRTRGEFVVSERGVEGGGIYEVSAAVRDGAALVVDLAPDMSVADVRSRLAKRKKNSLANFLRKSLRLDPVKIALLQEFGRPFPDDLAPVIKALPIRHNGPRPLDEAISVAGGVRFDAMNNRLMLRDRAGVFCAGEMLDWEAPTGGYLITGCLATGRYAANAAVDYVNEFGAS